MTSICPPHLYRHYNVLEIFNLTYYEKLKKGEKVLNLSLARTNDSLVMKSLAPPGWWRMNVGNIHPVSNAGEPYVSGGPDPERPRKYITGFTGGSPV